MKKNFIEFFFATFAIYACAACAATNELETLSGPNSQVTLENWSNHTKAWKKITFKDQQTSFKIYKENNNTDRHGNYFSIFSSSLSPNKKLLALQRIEVGELFLEDGSKKYTETSHCEFIDMTNGCVMQSKPAEYCAGKWSSNNKWTSQYPEQTQDLIVLETISPAQLIKKINKLSSPAEKASIIHGEIYMHPASYMACFPPSHRNIANLNDIAYFLAESGENQYALEFYRILEKFNPDRIPLKLNIADALWELNKNIEAKTYYNTYKELMINSRLTKKIPPRVFERAKGP